MNGRAKSGPPLFVGIDIGTQGVRAVAVTETGEVMGTARQPLAVPESGPDQEQDPQSWWDAVVDVIVQLGSLRDTVHSLAISCTSGSVCVLDASSTPIGPGLLYADSRGNGFDGKGASWAVAKIGWLTEQRPELIDRAAVFTSPGGYVASQLLGQPAAIDVTQALKFGFDPQESTWGVLPVDATLLPAVVPTGIELGTLSRKAATQTGLPRETNVVSGATDGVAGQFACRPSPQRWAVAIGSTIVWKALAAQRIDNNELGVYSHRGPGEWWLPGAASTAGARILSTWATDEPLASFDTMVQFDASVDPAYPSVVQGERFPFNARNFRPWSSVASSGVDRYASEVLGAVFVERWGCEVLVGQGCDAPASIATTGGAVSSNSWMQLRATVMQTPIECPAEPSSAFGAAVIAAAPALGGVLAAGDAMVRFTRTIEPEINETERWTDGFGRFQRRCLDQQKESDEYS